MVTVVKETSPPIDDEAYRLELFIGLHQLSG